MDYNCLGVTRIHTNDLHANCLTPISDLYNVPTADGAACMPLS